MNATPAKFTFDVDMGQPRDNTRVLDDDKLSALIEQARQEGYAQGKADGEATETARASQALQAAAEQLAEQAARLLDGVDAMRRETLGEAVGLGAAVGRKLAGHLVDRHPTAELEELINECMSSIGHAPHLVIRCHPDLAGTVQEIAETRMATGGFTGRLVVMGEEDIALGDGRIEWVDGGLVRDSAAMSEQIDTCIETYLAAKGAPAGKETDQ